MITLPSVDVDVHIPRNHPYLSIQVVAGVLIDPDQRILLTQRPAGKVYAGYWEFPGGKIEAKETWDAALRRELKEEIGVQAEHLQWMYEQVVAYPHAKIILRYGLVKSWLGEVQMCESQLGSWQRCPPDLAPILPATQLMLVDFAMSPFYAER
ncbi:MAG: NUDIX domain-containing protein [Gammaproteobacteria bacterium]|nr:NUDIX domain-containing protein [Gammaproteobacteria bacterium]